MTYVSVSSKLHSHPSFLRMRNQPRAICAWLWSICWLSRNGRADAFPRDLAATEFHARPRDIQALVEEKLWVDEGHQFHVPQWVLSPYARHEMQLWKFGPLDTYRPKIPASLRRAVYARDGHACLHCGTTESLSLDHIHPYSLGGQDTLENLQTLCRRCNSRKGARV